VLVNRTTLKAPESLIARAGNFVGLPGFGARAVPYTTTEDESEVQNMTARDAGTWILTRTPTSFQRMMETNYSNGFERDEEQLKRNNADPTKWTNPLEVQLPHAPSMKMYCVYGHGKDTEVRLFAEFTAHRPDRGREELME
jgi:hypothetical protein